MPSLSRSRRVRVGAYAHIRHEQKILLVKMKLGPFAGAWSLPGGGLDFAEEPLHGLMREVEEETGLRLSEEQCGLREVVSYKSTWTDPGKEPEDLHFLGVVFDVRLELWNLEHLRYDGDGESTECARWFQLEELPHTRLSPIFSKIIQGI